MNIHRGLVVQTLAQGAQSLTSLFLFYMLSIVKFSPRSVCNFLSNLQMHIHNRTYKHLRFHYPLRIIRRALIRVLSSTKTKQTQCDDPPFIGWVAKSHRNLCISMIWLIMPNLVALHQTD